MVIEIETILAAGTAILLAGTTAYEWIKARISAKELQMLVDSAREATAKASDGGSTVTDSEALGMISDAIGALSTID